MKGTKHSPEQIIRKLREADQLAGQGQDVAAVFGFAILVGPLQASR